MNKPSLIVKIIIAVVICQVMGLASGLVTFDAIPNWYADLNKPSFNPPNWLFGPAWTLLYTLMGIAAALIWHEGWNRPEVKQALGWFAAQLVLNAAWTLIFFGLKTPAWALIEIAILWAAILICIIHFFRIKSLAGYLMIPYLLWVSFAALLNFSIWQLN